MSPFSNSELKRYARVASKLTNYATSYLNYTNGDNSHQSEELRVMCAVEYAMNRFWSGMTTTEMEDMSVNYASRSYDNR